MHWWRRSFCPFSRSLLEMSSKFFTIQGNPGLTQELNSKVSLELKEKLDLKGSLEQALATRSKNLSRIPFLRLHVLHREFTGEEIPAIRFFITYARYANQSLRQLKTRLRRGS